MEIEPNTPSIHILIDNLTKNWKNIVVTKTKMKHNLMSTSWSFSTFATTMTTIVVVMWFISKHNNSMTNIFQHEDPSIPFAIPWLCSKIEITFQVHSHEQISYINFKNILSLYIVSNFVSGGALCRVFISTVHSSPYYMGAMWVI